MNWDVAKVFLEYNSLVKQHLDSYNNFVENKIQKIIDEIGLIESHQEGLAIKLGRVRLEKPRIVEADGSKRKIVPMEARLRNRSYVAQVFLEMTLVQNAVEKGTEEVFIGELPVMLKSKLCYLDGMNDEELIKNGEDPLDPGGYFIINGSERVLVAIEDLAPNRTIISKEKRGGKVITMVRIFSVKNGFRAKIGVERKHDGLFYVSFPASPKNLNIIPVLKALGLSSDKEVFEAFSGKREIINDLMLNMETIPIKDEEDAIDYIGKRVAAGQPTEYRKTRALQILDNYLLPHIGTSSEDRLKKAYFLCRMIDKATDVAMGKRNEDDKDHYANKRIKLSGMLMEELFRYGLSYFVKDVNYQIDRVFARGKKLQIKTLVRPDAMTDRIKYAMATGNWVGGRTGVSQLLDRITYLSALSHLRRVISPLSKVHPHFEARDLHPTHWCKIDPNETPEGQSCGLVKNFALGAIASSDYPEEKIGKEVNKLGVVFRKIEGASVYLNGKLIGFHINGPELVDSIKRKRRRGELSSEINVAYYPDVNEVYINCDAGRARRAAIIVEDGTPKLTKKHIQDLNSGKMKWNDLVEQGIVEYLDAEEEEISYVAMNEDEIKKEHTHLEIHPSLILGAVTSIVPFPNHNSSPRVTMAAAMLKQALGLYQANFNVRMDTQSHILYYPQVAITKTKQADIIGVNNRPAGQNMVVAIMPYYGYNMQDAVVINKASIERGLGRTVFYRTYVTEERRYPGGQKDRFELPKPEIQGYRGEEAYKYLGEDGIVMPECEVKGGDVLVGKTSPPRFLEEVGELSMIEEKRRENSVVLRHGEGGVVDTVMLTEAPTGNKLVKVRVRTELVPIIGDKFASRHGQKGVIGMVVPQHDMPFTADGITPDLIMNPHAVPSRMTVGHILELLGGKCMCLKGEHLNGTAFEPVDYEGLKKTLVEYGFKSDGKEIFYNGITGERIEAEIFVGVTYYQRLKHLVANKIHARSRGPVQILTRQPTEGRAREGGLRLGEMERDTLLGHGASMLLLERLLKESDVVIELICEKCGSPGVDDQIRKKRYCTVCESTDVKPVEMSYAFKLLLNELKALNIFPKVVLGDKA